MAASDGTDAEVRLAEHAASPLGMFDGPRYARIAVASKTDYAKALPFPHCTLDNFLPDKLYASVIRELPASGGPDWISRQTDNNRRRYQHDETKLPKLLRAVVREFSSRQLLLFLETLTGIDGLIADPYLLGGGLQYAGRGDYLKVHADWNWHHKLQLHRRVNALLYLTTEWDETWGGPLELWDSSDSLEPRVKLDPRPNRLVVFNTGTETYHGHPEPLECPSDVWRRALNMYFYTALAGDDPADPGFTRYRVTESPLAMSIMEGYLANAERDDDQTSL
jgi:Rps23 Pro-64 3,4-dihydroxylase Tpa1-like proline 4-hydroxylase